MLCNDGSCEAAGSCTGQWPQLEDEAHVCQAEQRQAAAEMVHSCHTGWVHLQLHCLTQVCQTAACL